MVTNDGHIYNKHGKEVFNEDTADRRAILANVAVLKKEATVVTYRNKRYVVYNDNRILSCTSKRFMNWPQNNGDRIAILMTAIEKNQKLNIR